MAEVIGFKIELPGAEKLTVVLKEQRELKQEIAATRKELKTKGLGTEEYAKLDKKLFELTTTQKTLRKETTQSRNEFIAAGKTGAGAYDRLSSSLRVVRTQSKNAQAEVVILTSKLDKLQKEGQQNTDEFKDLSGQLVKAKTAVTQLSPVVNKLDKELKQIDADSGQFQRNVGNYPKAIGGVTQAFGALGIAIGATELVSFGKESLSLFGEQEKAIKKVEQALISTGNSAGFSLQELKKEASDLQSQTIFGDEDILNKATAQLLTFTNITDDNFKRTQVAALDLATLLDGDLKSASIQLGKALNDPNANLSALSRSGIQFSEDQKKTIKALQDTNQLAEAQTIILDELSKQYGGQAAAAADTLTGKLDQLNNIWGDLKEGFGEGIAGVGEDILFITNTFGELLQILGLVDDKAEATSGTIEFISSVFKIVGNSIIGGPFIKGLRLVANNVQGVINLTRKLKDNLVGTSLGNFLGIKPSELESTEKSVTTIASTITDKLRGLVNESRTLAEENNKAFSSYDGLKKRSSELSAEIKDLSIKGKSYTNELKELRIIQGKLAAADGLTSKLKEEKQSVEAAKNSIEALSKVVSDLQSNLQSNDDPEFLQKTNEELITAQGNLKKAQDLLNRIQGNSQGVVGIKAPVELDIDLSALEAQIKDQEVIKLPLSLETQDIESQFLAIETERRSAILDFATTTQEQVNKINSDADLARLQLQLDLLNIEKEERIRIEEEIAEVKDAQREAEREKTFEEINFALEAVQTGVDVINQLFDARLEKNLNTLEQQRQTELEGVQGNAVEEEKVNKKFDKKKETLEKKSFERNKKLSIAQALVNGALAITRILADVPKGDFGIATGVLIGLATATTLAQVAAISAQEFATGGLVTGANIPAKRNGDNVLATLKTGEVVLNKQQQQGLANITGNNTSDIFSRLKVPGFVTGGVIGNPASIAPVGLIEQQVRQQTVIVNIDSEKVGREIANTIKLELEGIGNLPEQVEAATNILVERTELISEALLIENQAG